MEWGKNKTERFKYYYVVTTNMQLQNWEALEMMAKHVGVEIDPQKPRDSRLAVALKCDQLGKIPEAIEAMTAVLLPFYDRETLRFNLQQRIMDNDPRHFYEGFPAVDKP
jgi:hypothetical protein